ncbi:uncharacterized protein BYT42DRAFT_612596 [Radiomyces spectabilis]|uniref:uncharacterized protein n=1 Tax=Radiomyces spectabilis TaxID=64574 RepID=UPI0022208B6E|nr:uncharacterized protein BYT42DRAFT_612596 [Radiomyces spectabilis]KAI8384932.1 hypothetical protein BYT42DRAFT_612596 [Radiomyces spectabilis]
MAVGSHVISKYSNLDLKGHTLVEYVWLEDNGETFDSFTKSTRDPPQLYKALTMPLDSFGQKELKPATTFRDPFRGDYNKIVLCNKPLMSSQLDKCETAMTRIDCHVSSYLIKECYELSGRVGKAGMTPKDLQCPGRSGCDVLQASLLKHIIGPAYTLVST